MSQNLIACKCAKHIDLDCHFVRELVETHFLPLHIQQVDVFIRNSPRPSFELFRSKLRVDPHPTLHMRGLMREIVNYIRFRISKIYHIFLVTSRIFLVNML